MPQYDFKHSALNALKRLGLVRFAALGGYRKNI
jgi:hypothetical protein